MYALGEAELAGPVSKLEMLAGWEEERRIFQRRYELLEKEHELCLEYLRAQGVLTDD